MGNSTPATPTASAADRRDAWSRYWAGGAPHSCVGTYGDRYGGAIAAFWHEAFAAVPAMGRVLDVATGNGALPRLLLDQRREPGLTCDAVDIATLQPRWLAELAPADRARVRLHGGVDAAALPFGNAAFDLVASQYGIEYAAIDRAMAEVLRVRAPKGCVALVLHHVDGRPATLAGIELGHLDWLAESGGWFDAVAALLEPMARAATFAGRASLHGDAGANAARARFNALQQDLGARSAAGDGADVLFEMRDAAALLFELAGRDVAAAAAALATLRAELAAAATRLADLREHALDAGQAQALRGRLEASVGGKASLEELREQGHLMGWALRAVPAP